MRWIAGALFVGGILLGIGDRPAAAAIVIFAALIVLVLGERR